MTLSLDFATPVNTALLIYILYSVQKIVFPPISSPKTVPHEFKQGYSWMPKSHAPTVLFQTYTPKTLAPFNGKDSARILLAINGIVFDVTAGRNFYGPGTHSFGFVQGLEVVNIAQMVCMATSPVGMPREAWQNSLLIRVCHTSATPCIASHSSHHSEMLTPIDQPLDKLQNLRPDEMYVYPLDMQTCSDVCSAVKT